MKVVVFSSDKQWLYLNSLNPVCELMKVDNFASFETITDAEAFINLDDNAAFENYHFTKLPIFINSVLFSIEEREWPNNVIRLNAWEGFFETNIWEISGNIDETIISILNSFNKKWIVTLDEPGFISARIVAMIVNEAFFAKEDNISTENEIDIAMKLGTNYPFGPFEWAAKIGHQNIYDLLCKLAIHDERYTPSIALINSI